MRKFALILLLVFMGAGLASAWADSRKLTADLVIYSATPGGIVTGIAAQRAGLSVLIIEPTAKIGGMMTSGLGATDHCKKKVIGGISREFFKRVGQEYGVQISWRFEPHVAEKVFEELVREAGIRVLREESLRDVSVEERSITRVDTSSGKSFTGKIFIDASYEGDLFAKAGVSFSVGREPRSVFSEPQAGVLEYLKHRQLPYDLPARGKDGELLRFVSQQARAELGSGDGKVMAYNYRLCVTNETDNMVAFAKPEGYDPDDYQILISLLRRNPHTLLSDLFGFLPIPGNKYDLNASGAFSTDMPGQNWDYPEGDEATRDSIRSLHRRFTQGMFYFLQNDKRVPTLLRQNSNKLGLCKDEFRDNDHWPYQLYVREARRMVGEYVLTEHDLNRTIAKPDSVGMASCPIESHHVEIFEDENKNIKFEGWASGYVLPYQIPLRSLLTKKGEVDNLIVPVAISASHIAYSSLRMEPTYMVLGHSAGVLAAMAIQQGIAPREIPYSSLKEKLVSQNQILKPRQKPS